MYSRPWLSILPQLGVGGWTPSPRKPSDDSTMISSASWKLRRRWRAPPAVGRDVAEHDPRSPAPTARATVTNSRCFILSVDDPDQPRVDDPAAEHEHDDQVGSHGSSSAMTAMANRR